MSKSKNQKLEVFRQLLEKERNAGHDIDEDSLFPEREEKKMQRRLEKLQKRNQKLEDEKKSKEAKFNKLQLTYLNKLNYSYMGIVY